MWQMQQNLPGTSNQFTAGKKRLQKLQSKECKTTKSRKVRGYTTGEVFDTLRETALNTPHHLFVSKNFFRKFTE